MPGVESEPLPATCGAPATCDESLAACFAAVARERPDQLALVDPRGSLSYADLAALVEKLAGAIEAAGAARPGPVAILLGHDARFPAGILGALATDRGCVPLSADDPATRTQMIAADSQAAVVLSAGELAERARELFPHLPVIDMQESLAQESRPPRRTPSATDLAYIIYTSGSTGRPKGVYQNHRGMLDDLRRAAVNIGLSPQDRQALFYPPSLISGFRVALGSLLSGGTLYILPPRQLTPAGVAREIARHRITIFRAVPTLFRHVVESLRPQERLESLRMVLLGGDRVEWRDWDACRRACSPQCRFGVHLGATECSLYLQWFVDEDLRLRSPRLPVGRVLPDFDVMLLDEAGRAVGDGEAGEFWVRGPNLALGYWRDPERTARAFRADPADPARRTYRTGDLGRRRPDGLYEYLGRKDQQIKLHGQRIEPGEVEAALRDIAGVRDAAVVVRRNPLQTPLALVAYLELEGPVEVSTRELRRQLAQRIARHMMPARILITKELPRLPNLKIDRARLAQMDAQRTGAAAATQEVPRSRLESQLCEIYARLTGSARVAPRDDFFELGGDSLGTLLLITEIRQRLGRQVRLEEVFEHASPARLAECLSRAACATPQAAAQSRVYLLPGVGGDSPPLQRLRQLCAPSVRMRVLQYPDWPQLAAAQFDTTQLLRSLIEQIEAARPDGPVMLVGYSAGGVLAYALAQALLAAQRPVEMLVILDTSAGPVAPPAVSMRRGHRSLVRRLKLPGRLAFLGSLLWLPLAPRARGRRSDALAHALAIALAHPAARSLLRGLIFLRPARLPTRFRHYLHRWLCEELHLQQVNAWRTTHLAQPRRLDVPVVIFKAADAAASAAQAADLGWSPHCRALRSLSVPGDHDSMLEQPQIGVLSSRLLEVLAGREPVMLEPQSAI